MTRRGKCGRYAGRDGLCISCRRRVKKGGLINQVFRPWQRIAAKKGSR